MNPTHIFNTYADFLAREDKTVNGVSPDFAAMNADYSEQNRSNISCWNCEGCEGCEGCERCVDCADCEGCKGCKRCDDCERCEGCKGCKRCDDCERCVGCKGCEGCVDKEVQFIVPVIENIHAKVLAAVSAPGALNMSDWHTCDTTHCRAGWVVVLAGEEGKALEKKTSTSFAAMQIYHASSPIKVSPCRFYDTAEKAMEDMRRCAEEEANLTAGK